MLYLINFVGWEENERGVSWVFGAEISIFIDNLVNVFLKKNDLDLICRAHQVISYIRKFTKGSRGWLRILQQTTTGDSVLGAQLLWGVRQRRRCYDSR